MSTPSSDLVAREARRQLEILSEGADEIVPLEDFARKLERAIREKRPLRVKQGFDPTAPDIHLGHAVGLRKLRQFQDLGHQVVVIVGDYTGMVGDPSGRSKTRPQLSEAEVEANAQTYLEQFFRIVDRSKTEIHRNGEWFAPMRFTDILKLTSQYTLARLLERDDFAKRWKANQPISIHELLYPLMQGHDSVEIRADVELGGTEQKFNLLVGRTLQEAAGQEPQVILTLPILVGLDGEQRMSKSLGNYVGIAEAPGEQFGKLMSIPDAQILTFWSLAVGAGREEVETERRELESGRNPMASKKRMAERVVAIYHGAEEATRAREGFEQQFSKRGRPLEAVLWTLPESGPIALRKLLVDVGLAKSGGEARRKIEEGAVEVDERPATDPMGELELPADRVVLVRLGRRWVQVRSERGTGSPRASEGPVPIAG
ncbi:MAG: tyrosine--tRNA ligase [Candidatus Eiseniibacteriota bacterium]